MLRSFGFGVYGIQPYGGVPSLEQFVYFIPKLNVIRATTSPFGVTVNVTNPPDNGSLVIFRANDVRANFTELATVALGALPYTDSTANSTLNHKYTARFVYNFNGRTISTAPVGEPVYTYLQSNTI